MNETIIEANVDEISVPRDMERLVNTLKEALEQIQKNKDSLVVYKGLGKVKTDSGDIKLGIMVERIRD